MANPDPVPTPATMSGVVLLGHGGPEQLVFRTDLPVPTPGPNQVLIRCLAAGVNNTDINTRLGWYSKSVTGATDDRSITTGDDGGWSDALQFPRVQGADCCGVIVKTGADVSEGRIDERVLVRSMQAPLPETPSLTTAVLGSEMDGAFAEYVAVRSAEALSIDSTWSDVELASIPCAWSTAENLLHRGNVGAERVVITGASGGVGAAAVQLAKRRGAEVIAIAGASKHHALLAIGADAVVARDADLSESVAAESIDVVIDVVAGPAFPSLLAALRPHGRYVGAGAIAGPLVTLDVRDLYLKDLTLFGATEQPPEVFEHLVGYIERNEVTPMVAATYPLAQIHEAQERFMAKDFVGKIVLEVTAG